jgi:colicin import membrane protein
MMPPAKDATPEDDQAAKAAAEQAAKEKAEKAAADKAAKDEATAEKKAAKAAAEAQEYVVVNCGSSYKKPGEDPETSRHFALKHAIIEVDADEGERLVGLNAVRALSDLDDGEVTKLRALQVEAEEVPAVREHAEPLESHEAHAEKVKAAKATKAK